MCPAPTPWQVRPDRPPQRPGLPEAVLFDMDGLLVDTEVLWFEVQDEVMHGFGARWTEEDQHTTLGQSPEGAAGHLLRRAGVDLPWREIADDLVARMVRRLRHGVAMQPGALELLDALAADGLPRALVSNSRRVLVDAVLATVGTHRFDVTVSASEVTRGKPDPEPYLRAAQLLGVRPQRCVVLEDSATGTAAGLAAGAPSSRCPPWPRRGSTPGPMSSPPSRTSTSGCSSASSAGRPETARPAADPAPA